MAKIKRCPLDVGGLMGLIMSIPHILNGHEEDVDKDIPVLDGRIHHESDRHDIA